MGGVDQWQEYAEDMLGQIDNLAKVVMEYCPQCIHDNSACGAAAEAIERQHVLINELLEEREE